MTTLGSWFQVQQLARKLFIRPSDKKYAAWDFLSLAKFKSTDNLDLHFSKFVKNRKISNRGQERVHEADSSDPLHLLIATRPHA